MATFTIEFKNALKVDPGIESEILAKYPIFDEEYREWLNQQILDRFWNREIGQETVSMFRLALKRKLNLIMPLYNQHYEASRIKIDPLQTVSIKNVMSNTGSTTNTGTGVNESSTDSKSRALESAYPQTAIQDGNQYGTSGSESDGTTTANAKSTEESNTVQDEKRDGNTVGSTGHAATLLYQYRQTLVNVDELVLNELESLFFLLWDNGDEYTQNGRHTLYGHYS